MREYIVFVSKDHYNPLGIVRTLGEVGIRPIVIVVKGDLKMVTKSRYVKKKHFVDTPEQGIRLILSLYANSKNEKSYILTGDDTTVSTLDSHYEELKDYFYFYNAEANGRIKYFMDKEVQNKLAEKYGFRVAKTWRVNKGELPDDIEFPVITKALNSFGKEWKEIIRICHNEGELRTFYQEIKSDKILLQKYIEKVDEVSYDGFSINHGKELIFVQECRQVYTIEGNYSPYWKVRNCHNREFVEKAKKVIEEIQLEGIFEFEFMVDKEGKLWFLEINFRNTVLGWVTTVAGMPQVLLWCEAMDKKELPNNWYREIPKGFRAMAECWDYDARVKTRIVTKREWLKQYKKAQCKLYRGRRDIVPLFVFLWYKWRKM